MRLASIQPRDIVLVSKGGRRFHAHVEEITGGVVKLAPIERGISYRTAGPRELLEVWHRRRPRRADEQEDEPAEAPAPVSKGQLSLAGRLDTPAGRAG